VAATSLRVCVIGSRGRMGQAIVAAAQEVDGLVIAAEVDAGDSVEAGLNNCDVGIDFSTAGATEEICAAAEGLRRPLVIGTTGHSTAQGEAIKAHSKAIPIVLASNFSLGVNTLFWLTARAARLLGPSFQVEIEETHHVMKKDAPSGTAKTLAEILRAERGGRDVRVRSIREGEVVGEHIVSFSGPGEHLELVHQADSRETFAVGALTAAKWLIGRPAGLYSMQDVLGLTGDVQRL
jgi:4-hydroxy-tetrahydrodipicolinate reductase